MSDTFDEFIYKKETELMLQELDSKRWNALDALHEAVEENFHNRNGNGPMHGREHLEILYDAWQRAEKSYDEYLATFPPDDDE